MPISVLVFCTSQDYFGVCALVRLLCLSLILILIFFFFDAVGSYSCLVALWNCLIGICFEIFYFSHQLFDEKLIWGSRLIDIYIYIYIIFFLGPTEDHVYHPKNGCFVEFLDWYVF